MINKITLFVSILTILLVHISVLFMYKTDDKIITLAPNPTLTSISVRKVVLKQKEIKTEKKKIVKSKKVEIEVKKIVKKAKRKIPKKIVREIKKEPRKVVNKVDKIIKKVAKKTSPKITPSITKKVTPVVTKKVLIPESTKNIIRNEYLSKLRTKIERNKIYPKRAKRLKQEGKVTIAFEITKDGKIRSVSLKKGSSYKRLNDAAIKLLKKIAMFDPIPKELEKNKWAIEIPISYSIVNI